MTVDVAPQRRDAVEIAASVHIDKVVALTSLDDDWLIGEPCAHLGERMPQVGLIPGGKLFGIQIGKQIGHGASLPVGRTL